MTELELYKFCQDKEIDWRGDKLILWIDHFDIKDFADLLGYGYLSDGVNVCLLDFGTIEVEMNDICGYFGIKPEHILARKVIP